MATPCTPCEVLNNKALSQQGEPIKPCKGSSVLPSTETGQTPPKPTLAPSVPGCGTGGRIPKWACGILTEEDIKPHCAGQDILTPDCIGESMYRDVMAADEYAHRIRDSNAGETYNDAVLAFKDEKDAKKREFKKTQLLSSYPESHVTIEGVKYAVPNPFRAHTIRQSYGNEPATFFNPNPGESPYAAKVRSQNAALINNLSFDEIMMDRDMTIAFLEALWYCGRNPILAGERCTPAKVIAELRQFERIKMEDLKFKENKEATKENHWATLKLWMDKVVDLLSDEGFPKYSTASGVAAPLPEAVKAEVAKEEDTKEEPVKAEPVKAETEAIEAVKAEATESTSRLPPLRQRQPLIPINIPIINPGFRPGVPLRPTPGLGFRLPMFNMLAKGLAT